MTVAEGRLVTMTDRTSPNLPMNTTQLVGHSVSTVVGGLTPAMLGLLLLVLVGVGAAVYFLNILIKGQQQHLENLLEVQQHQMDRVLNTTAAQMTQVLRTARPRVRRAHGHDHGGEQAAPGTGRIPATTATTVGDIAMEGLIGTLIVVLIIVAIFGVLIWAVSAYLPVPQPFLNIILLIIVLIGILVVLQRLGVVSI